MGDDNIVVIDFYDRSNVTQKFVEEGWIKSLAGNHEVFELVCLDQTPGAVVLEN